MAVENKWVTRQLGECLSTIIDHRGKTPKKLGSDWIGQGIPTISAKNVNSGKLVARDSIIEVHRTLGGPGLLESVYEEALAWELNHAGLRVSRQVQLPIPYKGHTLATPLKIDLIVHDLVIVECKAVTKYNDVFSAQVLTYLRLTGLKLGLAINFWRKSRQRRGASRRQRLMTNI